VGLFEALPTGNAGAKSQKERAVSDGPLPRASGEGHPEGLVKGWTVSMIKQRGVEDSQSPTVGH